jgi:hypothetical protein
MIEVIIELDVESMPEDVKAKIKNLLWLFERHYKIKGRIAQINFVEPLNPENNDTETCN